QGEVPGWKVRGIPDLLRYETNSSRKIFKCADVRLRVVSGCQFVMTPLTCKERPGTSDAPTAERRAVCALAESIVIVAPPARAVRCVHFEHSVNNSQRVFNERVVRIANSITDQFEKAGINNVFGGKLISIARSLIRQY